jgi:cytochrome c551/c552
MRSLVYLLIILSVNLHSRALFAQNNGAELFDDNCADCHTIGEGDMSGPDLLGVEQKHSQDWLIKFIRSSKTMISNGDTKAVALFKKYEKEKMPNNDLSTSDILSILDYIKSFNKTVVKKELVYKKSEPVNSKNSVGNFNQVIKELEARQDVGEEELLKIDKKLDMLLEFHKKALSARITEEEISKGEALFEGRTPFKDDIPSCVSCHNNKEIDTLNWSPSALDIADAFSHQDNAEMIDLIINPKSGKMQKVLKNHRLTDDESFYITAYLKDVQRNGLKPIKKLPIHRIVFVGVSIIMLLLLFDLLITKQIKYKVVSLFTILFLLAYIIYTAYHEAKMVGLNQNYAPVQPIKFSHRVHVKENEISCLFCHNGPEYSRESGIPTTNVCMICHNKIKSGQHTGEFEISKVRKSFEEKRPIVWTKIHNLPDYVFFSHAEHVSNGKIDCRECHGAVEEMDVTYQYESLSMGWCVQCHRKTEVQFKSNKFYSGYESLIKELESGKIKKVTADMIGANDCQKCHY